MRRHYDTRHCADNLATLFAHFPDPPADIDVVKRTLLRLSNPTLHTAQAVDCATCHEASQASQILVNDDFEVIDDGVPNRFHTQKTIAARHVRDFQNMRTTLASPNTSTPNRRR